MGLYGVRYSLIIIYSWLHHISLLTFAHSCLISGYSIIDQRRNMLSLPDGQTSWFPTNLGKVQCMSLSFRLLIFHDCVKRVVLV